MKMKLTALLLLLLLFALTAAACAKEEKPANASDWSSIAQSADVSSTQPVYYQD
ncbi:MAG: hypothetical protein LBQ33_02095 [Oscillospiraceae bacterium]|jgi:hypothetical protein|nr:hypothetical protein [Oscillospiraceae bacterium]